MYTLSSDYYERMAQAVRPKTYVKVIVHASGGDLTFDYTDLISFSETKTAHPISAELPSIQVSFSINNIAGAFNPFSPTGYYDEILKGVRVTYWYGYAEPNLKEYGYTIPPDEEAVFGFEETPTVWPYQFIDGELYQFYQGGEVFTTGELSYDSLSVTISCADALSFLEDPIGPVKPVGAVFFGDLIDLIMPKTNYPVDGDGLPKVVVDEDLYDTAILKTGYEDTNGSAKTVLQSIAHASCVQMYIDRTGYLHFDKVPESGAYSQYTLPRSMQYEGLSVTKGKIASGIEITVNSKYLDPVTETLEGNGELCKVSNNFVQSLELGRELKDRTKEFLLMRNIAEIEYRGEPSLDILDRITVPIRLYGVTNADAEATITSHTIQYDGALTGSMTIRFQTPETAVGQVRIAGAENFIYPYLATAPTSTSQSLVATVADITPTSYTWEYYDPSTSLWTALSETTDTLTMDYDDAEFGDKSRAITFRVTVGSATVTKAATASIAHIYVQKTETASYQGTTDTIPDADPEVYEVGDTVLITENEGSEDGHMYLYNGDDWVETTASDDLADGLKDALDYAASSGDEIFAATAYINSLFATEIVIQTGGSIHSPYYDKDGAVVSGSGLDRGFYIGANGELKAVNGEFSGTIYATDGTFNGTGTFRGNFETDLFTVKKAEDEVEATFASPALWAIGGGDYSFTGSDTDGYPYDTMWNTWTFIAKQVSPDLLFVSYNDVTRFDWSSATSVTGTIESFNIVKMIRFYGNGGRSNATGIAVLFDDDSGYWWPSEIGSVSPTIELTAPDSYTTDDILEISSTSSFMTALSGLTSGVEYVASGTITHNGIARSITSIVAPYLLKYSGGAITIVSSMNISGTLTIDANPDTVEFAVSPTPTGSDVDIGKSTDEFRDGWFSGAVNIGDGTSYSSSKGYSTLPNGLLMQFGTTGQIDIDAYETISFSKSFPSAVYSITVTPIITAGSGYRMGTVSDVSTSSFRVYNDGSANDVSFYWLAIGK